MCMLHRLELASHLNKFHHEKKQTKIKRTQLLALKHTLLYCIEKLLQRT